MGGTRFLGLEVVRQLLDAGHEVTVFHRGSRHPWWEAHVTTITGDRTVPDDLRRLAEVRPDAVLDLSAYTSAQTEILLDALGDAPRWVHVSTLNVYQPQHVLPWVEAMPYGPYPFWGNYAVEKIGCERALRTQRTQRTVSLRFPLVLGPGNFLPREEFVLNRLLDRATILLSGDGQAVHQYVWIEHAAHALAAALELDVDGFAAFNVASRRCMTSLEGFVGVCAEVSGTVPDVRRVGGGATGNDREQFDNANCVFPFSNENTFADLSAADAAGLLSPYMSLHEMIRAALEHLQENPERRRWTRTEAERAAMGRIGIQDAG
jgi:nucleoside-diphosphate-sugar epimerase